jgi:hypothetical protein
MPTTEVLSTISRSARVLVSLPSSCLRSLTSEKKVRVAVPPSQGTSVTPMSIHFTRPSVICKRIS